MLTQGNDISIRAVQHYLYCPHRWGLMYIDCDWVENYFVTKGNLTHNRVHENGTYLTATKRVLTSVPVYSDEMGLYGITDCIELQKSVDGTIIPGLSGQYELTIVEYKPTMPKNKKPNEADVIQVLAQKVCVDSVFQTDAKAAMYYASAKRRIPLMFHADQYNLLYRIVDEIKEYTEKGIVPSIRENQYCGGCSMKDICMPKKSVKKTFRERIAEEI